MMNSSRSLTFAFISCVTFLLSNVAQGEQFLRSSRKLSVDGAEKPKIFTFYAQLEDGETITRMTKDKDEELLSLWEQAWSEAGWDAQVIGMKEAKKHPLFKSLMGKILDLELDEYSALCLVRWIAMAAEGGGWMTDYDTFPLNDFRMDGHKHFLPAGGLLTVWNEYTPSLVSGTGHEYIRLLNRMIEAIVDRKLDQGRVDIMSLKYLYESSRGDMYHLRKQVLAGERALNGVLEWGEEECALTAEMRAVHFSHRSMKVGRTHRDGQVPQDRPEVAVEFLEMWNTKCPLNVLSEQETHIESARN